LDDLGVDEPDGIATNDLDSPSASLDPVADVSRRGLELPQGKRHIRHGRQLVRPEEAKPAAYTPQQRLMILDCWQRRGLPAKDFATLVGISRNILVDEASDPACSGAGWSGSVRGACGRWI
jgi:hypothetical protein